MQPVQDKAEVSIDFPDKFYIGSFLRSSKFEARAEGDGLLIKLLRPGDQKRVVELHLHHHLLADILSAWGGLARQAAADGRGSSRDPGRGPQAGRKGPCKAGSGR